MTLRSFPRIFPANFIAYSVLDVFSFSALISRWVVELSSRDRDRHCLSKMCLACPAICFVIPGTQMVLCNCVVSFSLYQNRHRITVSQEKTLSCLQALLQVHIKLPRCSCLHCWSNHLLELLHFGNRGRVTRFLALGPWKAASFWKFQSEAFHDSSLAFYPTQKRATLLVDGCSMCSSPFSAKVTISPKENKRGSESFINFGAWNE